jgi:glucose/arabinose dehydrogenase
MTTSTLRSGRRVRPHVEQLESRDCPAAVLDPNLAVRDAITGLNQPTGLAFLGANDVLVTEKASGMVKRFTNGVANGVPLDLPVNSASERGLLSIALHPNFAANHFVYLYWTQSTSGADSASISDVPDLGNRVDRFVWNGSSLTFDRNIIMLHARQTDVTNGREAGNHNGGKVKFGPDGKLYVMIGDNGRRGQMQNLPDGPFGNGQPDDSLGGPELDAAHVTGVIFRLNDDGTAPRDNPFFRAGEEWGGSAGASLQKVFAYGLRNGFGMAFDPVRGDLWDAQNGDDSFSEVNRIEAGANLGWVQVMGPLSRVAQFKAIETSTAIDPVTKSSYFGLQQNRWSPINIADTPEEALSRMFQVVENAKKFDATLVGSEQAPSPVDTAASADLEIKVEHDGTLRYRLKATGPIHGVTASHLHLGADGQNGDVVAFLARFTTPRDFKKGDTIAEGTITQADLIARTGFANPTLAELVARMKQGRIYANLHTTANPAGEIRGQMTPRGHQVSHYSDPEFSWKYEIAPTGLGFLSGSALGAQYAGDMFLGEARTFLENGYLFRLDLSHNRKEIASSDPRLADKVADNFNKFDITESESLLFGTGFGITTEILTGPNGNLFVLSLSDGILREISRAAAGSRASVSGLSLASNEATPPTPTPPAPAAPRQAAVSIAPLLEDSGHRVEESAVTRSVRDDGSKPAADDLLGFDPVMVG